MDAKEKWPEHFDQIEINGVVFTYLNPHRGEQGAPSDNGSPPDDRGVRHTTLHWWRVDWPTRVDMPKGFEQLKFCPLTHAMVMAVWRARHGG